MKKLLLLALVTKLAFSMGREVQFDTIPLNFAGTTLQTPYEIIDGDVTVFGDVIVGTAAELENAQRQKGVSLTLDFIGDQWPGGIVPYVIHDNLPDKDRIEWAINMYHQHTNIRLVPRTTERDYIEFKRSTKRCNSWIGRKGGRQVINLKDSCSGGNAMHEIMHALGFFHEHQRHDRNRYVKIKYRNMKLRSSFNFIRYPHSIAKTHGPYDFNSIMHYSERAFSKNGRKTMVRRDGKRIRYNREMFSELDLVAIANLYGEREWPSFRFVSYVPHRF